MENQIQKQDFKSIINSDKVKEKFAEILKEKSSGFIANLSVMVSNSEQLSDCDPFSIVSAAVISASLDLPLDPNLGYAAIVPFNKKINNQFVKYAQFQIMYKGFIQLSLRTNMFRRMGCQEVYEGSIITCDRFNEVFLFDDRKKISNKVVGYYAFFELTNGFFKQDFWDIEKIERHAQKYSQTYKKGFGNWKDNFDAMAKKTVLKSILSQFAPKTIELNTAVISDQAVINGIDDAKFEYIDNQQQIDIPLVNKIGEMKLKEIEGNEQANQ